MNVHEKNTRIAHYTLLAYDPLINFSFFRKINMDEEKSEKSKYSLLLKRTKSRTHRRGLFPINSLVHAFMNL